MRVQSLCIYAQALSLLLDADVACFLSALHFLDPLEKLAIEGHVALAMTSVIAGEANASQGTLAQMCSRGTLVIKGHQRGQGRKRSIQTGSRLETTATNQVWQANS